MVVLLIGMAVAAVAMSAILPTWRQQATREKEEELIFRGTQYARAIFLYNAKTGTFPNDIDVLVSQHYLRKKYLDPITGKDFAIIAGAPPGQGGAPAGGGQGQGRGGGPVTTGGGAPAGPGRAGGTAPSSGARPPTTTGGQTPAGGGTSPSGGGQLVGGIQGVYSTSNATSIKIYQGAQEYDQWLFRFSDVAAQMRGQQGLAPGGAGNGRNGQGGPGGVGPGGQGAPAGGRGPLGPGGRGPGGNGPVGPGGVPGTVGRGPGRGGG